MPSISRRTLLPGLGFALVLAAALAVALTGGGAPEAGLRDDVRTYLRALAAGDAPAAAAFRVDHDPDPERPRAQALVRHAWMIEDQEILEGGEEAFVTVRWIAPGGRRGREIQHWRCLGDHRWAFVALER